MKTVELYARVRHAVTIEGISERAAAERFGINARTVRINVTYELPARAHGSRGFVLQIAEPIDSNIITPIEDAWATVCSTWC